MDCDRNHFQNHVSSSWKKTKQNRKISRTLTKYFEERKLQMPMQNSRFEMEFARLLEFFLPDMGRSISYVESIICAGLYVTEKDRLTS